MTVLHFFEVRGFNSTSKSHGLPDYDVQFNQLVISGDSPASRFILQ
jgi:hypothetical protein